MYLLDTHVILWYILGDTHLSEKAKYAMEKEKCFYSYASLWELSIKQSLKKLDFGSSIPALKQTLENEEFENLPITEYDFEYLKKLPFYHKDPFDRILISQAQENNLTLITHDSIMSKYEIKTLW